MEITIKDEELTDYATINGELYIKSKALASCLNNMNGYPLEEILKDGLGIDENGDRI